MAKYFNSSNNFLTLILVFQILDVNFSPIENKHIEKVVTIESFDTNPSQDVIPGNHNHNPKPLHDTCTTHSTRACKTASFCVLLDGEKCVGGNKHGPTYLTQDGDKVDYNYYYHKTNVMVNVQKKEVIKRKIDIDIKISTSSIHSYDYPS